MVKAALFKSVIITGASSGIGKAMAEEFAARGYNLGLVARRQELLEAIQSDFEQRYQIKVEIAALDVTDTDAIYPTLQDLKKRLDQVDIVIANAGITALTQDRASPPGPKHPGKIARYRADMSNGRRFGPSWRLF